MNSLLAVRLIGASHMLQPPLTLLMARHLTLPREFARLPELHGQLTRNMAFASVFLPTSAGCLIGLFAPEVISGHPMIWLARLLAAFWCWRLARQWALGPLLPRRWHWTLLAIFVVQGPLFAAFLTWAVPS